MIRDATAPLCTEGVMSSCVALLRAVNVGGSSVLKMSDLRALCEAEGFLNVRTYIASGNVVFRTDRPEAEIKARIKAALASLLPSPPEIFVRTGEEMAAVIRDNPFPLGAPNKTFAIFLDHPPPADAAAAARGLSNEAIALGRRELYVHYPSGAGASKLRIPAAAGGTARNLNTLARLAAWAAG